MATVDQLVLKIVDPVMKGKDDRSQGHHEVKGQADDADYVMGIELV